MPRRLPIKQLKEGMILAEPVVDRLGRALIGQGELLNDRRIAQLERFQIAEVAVAGEGDAAPAGGPAADGAGVVVKEEWVDRMLQEKFKGLDSPELGMLKSCARRHLLSGRLRVSEDGSVLPGA
jgi:hypothetical protein